MMSFGFHNLQKEAHQKDGNRIRFDVDEDDDDEDWISLTTEDDDKKSVGEEKVSPSNTFSTNKKLSNRSDDPNISHSESIEIPGLLHTEKNIKMPNISNTSVRNYSNTGKKSLDTIQMELEKKIHFQKMIIQDPLHSYPFLFLKHLMNQTWKLHFRIRLGLVCLFIGSLLYLLQSLAQFKSLLLVFFFLLAIIISIGYLYFYRWHDMMKIYTTENNIRNVRFIFILLLYVPTFLEVQSYLMFVNLLVQNHYSSNSLLPIATSTSLDNGSVCGLLCTRTRSWLWVSCLVSTQTLCIYYWRTKSKFSYQKCHEYTRTRLLQILAFLVSLYNFQNGYAHIYLGGPLFMSLGVFFISSVSSSSNDVNSKSNDSTSDDHDQMEWVSRIIRLAIRLTLRDVLSNLGDNIAEDEMLQVTMLRWIVDYWAYQYQAKEEKQQHTKNETHKTPYDQSTESKQKSSSSNLSSKSLLLESRGHSTIPASKRTANVDSTAFKDSTTEINENLRDTSTSQKPFSSTKKAPILSSNKYETSYKIASVNEITWDDLFEMLSATTDLMKSEIKYYPNHQNHGNYTTSPSFNSSSSNSNMKTEHFPSSIENLKSLLSTIDVNNKARPAVLAYKNTIHSLPPSNQICESFATIKKCPTFVSIFILFLFSSFYIDSDVVGITNKEQILLKSVILIPSIVLEVIRILRWYDSIHQLEKNKTYGMTLLLSTNTDVPHIMIHYKPSTLLKVWYNLCNSTIVLEQGLKGVKCAQTSLVVRDFCDNAVSLAGLGFEVYQKGWMHGAGVIATEVFTSIGNKKMRNVDDQNGKTIHFEKGTYMNDAVDILKNGSIVIQNLSELIDDYEEEQGELHSIIGGLLFASGRGWLWGVRNKKEHNEMKNDQDFDDFDTNDETKNPKSTEVENESKNTDDNDSFSMLLQDAISETMRLNKRMKNVEDFSKQSFSEDIQKDSHSQYIVEEKNSRNEMSLNSSFEDRQTVDDIAKLLELTANALDQNLITEQEKDNIMEMILKAKQNNEANDVSILENIHKTLQQHINNDEAQFSSISMHSKHQDVCSGNTPKFGRDSNYDTENKNIIHDSSKDKLLNSTNDDIPSIEKGSKMGEEASGENNICNLCEGNQYFKDLDRKPDNSKKNDDLSNEGGEKSRNLFSGDATLDHDCEDDSWTTVVNNVVEDEAIKRPSSGNDKMIKNVGEQAGNQNNEKDNLLHVIGGGLAVLGAVVGGLAVLSGNSKDHNKSKNLNVAKDDSKKTIHHYNSSKVIIEELDDNEKK